MHGQFQLELHGHFELELGAHFKLELGGQYGWNLQPNIQAFDHKEKRMAEALVFLRELKRKKTLANG